jgi:hypothetical protein
MRDSYNLMKSTQKPGDSSLTPFLTVAGSAAHYFEDQLDEANDAGDNQKKKVKLEGLQREKEAIDKATEAQKKQKQELEAYLSVLHRVEDELQRSRDEEQKLLDEGDKLRRGILGDMTQTPELKNQTQFTEMVVGRIEAAKRLQETLRDGAEAQKLWSVQVAESTHTLTAQQAAIARQQIELERLNEQLAQQKQDQAIAEANPEMWTKGFNDVTTAAQVAATQQQIIGLTNQVGLEQYMQTFSGSMNTMFNDWIEKATDMRAKMAEFWSSMTEGVNNVLSKMMTGQYKKGDWGRAGMEILGGASKSSLQAAEGFGLKALGFGGGKLGTKESPMYTRSADGIPGAGVGGAAGNGLLGMMNDSNFFSGLFGGKLFGAGGVFAGALAGGGDFSPGYYLVGERGPEIAAIGSSGTMHDADATRRILGGSGGPGAEVHNWNIDARGTDPSLTRANFERALVVTHQHAVQAASRQMVEQARRRPQR